MLRKLVALGAVVALTLTACGGDAAEGDGSHKIGIATIVSHPALDAVADGFKEAMAEAGYAEGEQLEIDFQNAQGDQSTITNIANTFASSDYDGFLAIATPTAQALANAITDRPIVFGAVTDPVAAGLTQSWDAPDGNVTGVSDMNPMEAQLDLIKEVAPDVATVGIVYSSGEVNSEVQVTEAEKAAESRGIEIVTATVTNSSEVQQAAESLDVDAYLLPTDNTVVSAAESLVQVAEQKSVPVFASDESTMERGASAGLSVNYTQQGRDAAAVLLKMLDGTPASEIPVETQKEFDLFVNEAAATAQGIELPQAVIDRATKEF
ncbi:ABC transporter substrate-binding protein [Tessaracoccus massiliensis]|uniref:ABC transporter substrate-binding protein n=1 Tax=Tessaracoccus massiliensis TaxID=1522311 RepID=UPI00058BE825|nr:ABC transporter substrate-binding protein [Tessaracoccus massiliensis]